MGAFRISAATTRRIKIEVRFGDEFTTLSGATLIFAAKENLSDADIDAAIYKTSADSDEIEIEDAAAGLAWLNIEPSDTDSYAAEGIVLSYSLKAQDAEEAIFPLDSGQLVVEASAIESTL
jgi:hypothetical protein